MTSKELANRLITELPNELKLWLGVEWYGYKSLYNNWYSSDPYDI